MAMRARLRGPCACAAALLLAACASPVRTTELAAIDQGSGYRYATLEAKAPKTIDKAAVIVTFSGGGTPAAALAGRGRGGLARPPGRGGGGRAAARQPDRPDLLGVGRQRHGGLFRDGRSRRA